MPYTVDQLCASASAISGLSGSSGSIDRALLEQFIDDAMTEIFIETSCVVTDITVTLTAGVDEYEMDRGILRILNYAHPSSASTSVITVIPAEELLQRRFLVSAGSVRRYAVLGFNMLLVSPPPTDAEVIHFYAVPVPDSVVDDGTNDVFATGLPVYAKRALQAYVYARGAEVNSDLQTSQFWDQQFVLECGKIRKRGRDLGGRKLAPGRIGYPDVYRGPTRNDTYSSED